MPNPMRSTVVQPARMGVRFDGDRKYIIEEGDFKVSIWKDTGMVYAMVI